ncbi:dodecin family protein [Microvirga massiliensis]|uniref:dodecin family protein n=1 Tax=Microvirga massiliensis TaxID=1033741 RepID=UPI000A3FA539|nr:dodecin family protein [Microvirga massiliensis]
MKFLELSAQSPNAVRQAVDRVDRASSTLCNIRSVWAKEFEAVVENDKVSQFQVAVKISFELKEGGA